MANCQARDGEGEAEGGGRGEDARPAEGGEEEGAAGRPEAAGGQEEDHERNGAHCEREIQSILQIMSVLGPNSIGEKILAKS